MKRSNEQDVRNRNFGAPNGNYERNAVVKNQGTKQRVQRILGDCWQCESNGQFSRWDNCSFRHDINKRGKMTQSTPSPNSFMRQNERNASRTRSPRGRSPSGTTAEFFSEIFYAAECEKCIENQNSQRQESEWKNVSIAVQSLPRRNLHHSTVKNGILQNACSTSRRMDADLGKSALLRIDRLTNSPARSLKRMVTKMRSGYVENYTTIGVRISRYGAGEVFIDFAEELKHAEASPMCSID